MTRALAHRGARLHRFQRFDFEVNGRVYARPFVDYKAYPDGFDGEPGIEVSGMPLPLARTLAKAIRGG